MLKRTIPVAACALLLAGLIAPVAAKKPTDKAATSKLTFKLDDHSVATGEDVTGTVKLTEAKKGKKKSSPIASAPLTVQVDGVDVTTLTTGADGTATLTLSGIADGEHVAKVIYAGDATHKKASGTQGFTVGAAEEDETPDPEPSPSV